MKRVGGALLHDPELPRQLLERPARLAPATVQREDDEDEHYRQGDTRHRDREARLLGEEIASGYWYRHRSVLRPQNLSSNKPPGSLSGHLHLLLAAAAGRARPVASIFARGRPRHCPAPTFRCPIRPCVLITMRSTPSLSAAATMPSVAFPTVTRMSVGTPFAVRSPAAEERKF